VERPPAAASLLLSFKAKLSALLFPVARPPFKARLSSVTILELPMLQIVVDQLSSGWSRTGRAPMEKQELPRADEDRRAFLRTAGKIAVVVPPAMSLLLSTGMSSPAIAASGSTASRGNNGLGNGLDPQPPGNPPINDGPGTSPGDPGNRGHGHS
jgi:hypothetical protein